MKSALLYGIVAGSKTRVYCIFCGVYIPKASKCIEQHLNGGRHKEHMEVMRENGIIYNDGALYCRPCKLSLPHEISVIKHLDNENHSNWMAAMDDLVDGEFITLDRYLSSEQEDVTCEVCNINIECTLQSIEAHVNDISHRANIAERLKPLNGIFPVDNGDEVWCKVCDTYIENTIRGILSHIDDDAQHMEWFTEIEDLIEEQEVSLESYLANEHEMNVFCKKCHTEVLCTMQTIQAHVNSDAHLMNFGL